MGGRFGKCLDSPGEPSIATQFYRDNLESDDDRRVRQYGEKGAKHWEDFTKYIEKTTPAGARDGPTKVKSGGSKKNSKKNKTKKRNSKKHKTKKRISKKRKLKR